MPRLILLIVHHTTSQIMLFSLWLHTRVKDWNSITSFWLLPIIRTGLIQREIITNLFCHATSSMYVTLAVLMTRESVCFLSPLRAPKPCFICLIVLLTLAAPKLSASSTSIFAKAVTRQRVWLSQNHSIRWSSRKLPTSQPKISRQAPGLTIIYQKTTNARIFWCHSSSIIVSHQLTLIALSTSNMAGQKTSLRASLFARQANIVSLPPMVLLYTKLWTSSAKSNSTTRLSFSIFMPWLTIAMLATKNAQTFTNVATASCVAFWRSVAKLYAKPLPNPSIISPTKTSCLATHS